MHLKNWMVSTCQDKWVQAEEVQSESKSDWPILNLIKYVDDIMTQGGKECLLYVNKALLRRRARLKQARVSIKDRPLKVFSRNYYFKV